MPQPVYVVKSTHPRVFLGSSSEVTALVTKATTGGTGTIVDYNPVLVHWRWWYENKFLPYVNDASHSGSSLIGATGSLKNSPNRKLLTLSLGGAITGNTVKDRAITIGLYLANNHAANQSQLDTLGRTEQREVIVALAAVYDLCHDRMSDSDKSTIGKAILRASDDLSKDLNELMDGHTRINYEVQVIGSLAIYGESGTGFDFTSGADNATTRLNNALDFLYGGNGAISHNGYAALDTDRFFSQSGGAGKGAFYSYRSHWGLLQALHCLKNACSTFQISGENYDPVNSESWTQNLIHWFLFAGHRPEGGSSDLTYFRIGDTTRQSNRYNEEQRVTHAFAGKYGNLKREALWLHNAFHVAVSAPFNDATYYPIWEFICVDPTANPELSPGSPLSAIDNTAFFAKPGYAWYNERWFRSFTGTKILITCPEFYYEGHQDFDRGGMQIWCDGDMVLVNSGYFGSDSAAQDGGSHNNNWCRQSISKSGIPLIDNGATNVHTLRDENGNQQTYPSGEGGQYARKFAGGLDPQNVNDMQTEGSGLAWKMVEGRTQGVGMEQIHSDAEIDFYFANIRRSYLLESSDYDTGSDRTKRVDLAWMIIKNPAPQIPWDFPMVFRIARVESRVATHQKAEVWHSYGAPQAMSDGGNPGHLMEGLSSRGQIRIYYYQPTNFNMATVGGGSAITGGYGDHWFFYDPHDGSNGKNFPPAAAINVTTHQQDLGRFYLRVRPKTFVAENYFVCLLAPSAITPTMPSFSFFEEQSFFGVNISGRVYRIGKDLVTFSSPDAPTDTTPPAPPTGVAASSPASQTTKVIWDSNDETDMVNGGRYKVYERIKV